jgi:hypothetical protein
MLALLLLVASASAWSIGETICADAGLNLRNGACGSVVATSNGNERGNITAIQGPMTCSLGTYTWLQFQLEDYGPIYWGAAETGLLFDCGIGSGKAIPGVPYVNQRWDTGNSFDGSWACGPTSAVMAVSYFKKLGVHNMNTSDPWNHPNAYGWYDSSIYTSPTGYVFNAMQLDASGHPAYGAYGSCVIDGDAYAYLIQDYVENHGGLTATFYSSTTFSLVQSAINAGHLVIQSTMLSSEGHIVLITGYQSDGSVIVHDPWGDDDLPNWGIYPNGAYVTYTWSKLAAAWCIVIAPTALPVGSTPRAPREFFVPHNKPF